MSQQTVVKGANRAGLMLVRKPVGRVTAAVGLREATTGRMVSVATEAYAVPKPLRLERVWAVGEAVAGEAEPTGGPVPVELASKTFPAELASETFPVELASKTFPVELAFYRKYTEGLLRRYVRVSTAAGRVPSLLGRELFQGNVTSYRVHSFEDVVIFCYDVERILARLGPLDKELIRRIAMQQYTQGEAAGMLGVSLRNSIRLYGLALDRLTEMLLGAKLLDPQNCCQ